MIDMIDILERHSAYAPFFVLRVLTAGYIPFESLRKAA